jgi:hypothetical protein
LDRHVGLKRFLAPFWRPVSERPGVTDSGKEKSLHFSRDRVHGIFLSRAAATSNWKSTLRDKRQCGDGSRSGVVRRGLFRHLLNCLLHI